METKSKRISLSRLDKYVENQEAFGWEVVSKEDLRPNNTVLVIMQRDKAGFANYDKVKSLENQYNKIARPYPIATVVLTVIGLAFLVAYLFLKQTLFFAIIFFYFALTFFSMDSSKKYLIALAPPTKARLFPLKVPLCSAGL